MTDSMSRKVPKAKLPRKRKKAAIKAQGRKWYCDTIKFFYISLNDPRIAEKRCKFWVNSSIRPHVKIVRGVPFVVNEATRFW